MELSIEKPKTYKGLSYVLKSSLLKNALEETGLELNVHLVFWTPQELGPILSAEYWLPNNNVPYDRFYIRAGVVKSEDRKVAQTLMEDVIIPDLVRRIQTIKSLPEDSSKLKSGWFFDANFVDGVLKINGKEYATG